MDADAEFMSSYVDSMTMPAVCVWIEGKNNNPPDADMNTDKPAIPVRTCPDFRCLRRIEACRLPATALDRSAPQVDGGPAAGAA
jgi:hypothetical protein